MPIREGRQVPTEREKHWNQSVNLSTFVEHARGKTLEKLRAEGSFDSTFQIGPFESTSERENGPNEKGKPFYIKDPLDPPGENGEPGGVIDAKHFVAAALAPLGSGEWLGLVVENQQEWKGQESGHFEEDYKSNFLGVVFRNNYWNRDGDVSDEIQEFFKDYEEGNLRGFWPTVDRLTEVAAERGQAGLRELQELQNLLEGRVERGLENLQEMPGRIFDRFQDGLRGLGDRFSSAGPGQKGLETARGDSSGKDAVAQTVDTERTESLVDVQSLPTLRPQARGSEVEVLQTRLGNLGYEVGKIDGIYGAQVTAAVREFQSDRGLEVDGTVGPQTWQALAAAPEQRQTLESPVVSPDLPDTLRPEAQGPQVEALQTRLGNLGYEVGKIDGIYGAQVTAAVREFQRDRGLEVDGTVGPQTWQAIAEAEAASEQTQPTERTPEGDSLPQRIWQNFTEALGLAAEAGQDSVRFALPDSDREVVISGNPENQTILGTIGPGTEFFARLQVRDGELFADISQPVVAAEATDRLEEALQAAELAARDSQTVLEA